MKKHEMIKVLLIGGVVYELVNLAYQFGKGDMLGTLTGFDVGPDDILPQLLCDQSMRAKTIIFSAKWTNDRIQKDLRKGAV